MRAHDICRAALDKWGAQAQTLMVFEEMAELQKELCKRARGRDNRDAIAEEIADVQIVLEQMALLYGQEEVGKWRRIKLRRLEKRIKGEHENEETVEGLDAGGGPGGVRRKKRGLRKLSLLSGSRVRLYGLR